eukprot:PITA_30458
MPSRQKFHLVKVEAKGDQMLEEEEEAHIEVEDAALQVQVEEVAIKIQVKAQDKIKHKVRDSGYRNHMTGNIEMFSNLDEGLKCEVALGIDRKISVIGTGSVIILTKKGETKYMSNVYFFPPLKRSLIRISQVMEKGYNVFFKNDECTILGKPPNKQLIAKVHMTTNIMFPLKIKLYLKEEGAQAKISINSQEDEGNDTIVTQVNFHAEVKDENWLWHLIFGHLNFGGLNLLHRKSNVNGLPLVEK